MCNTAFGQKNNSRAGFKRKGKIMAIINCKWCGRPFDDSNGYGIGLNYDKFCSRKCYQEYYEKHGDCFITTAVCKTLNKPDNCAELTTLRNFRDIFMQETPEMNEEVHEYYHIAPQICAEIEKTEDSGTATYTAIWEKYLKPAVEAVEQKENRKAHDIYKQMVMDLKREYLG